MARLALIAAAGAASVRNMETSLVQGVPVEVFNPLGTVEMDVLRPRAHDGQIYCWGSRPERRPTKGAAKKDGQRPVLGEAGSVEGVDEVVNEYGDFYSRVFVPLVVPVLRELGVRATARQTGHGIGAVSAALSMESRPRRRALDAYTAAAANFARQRLADQAIAQPAQPVGALRQFLTRIRDQA